MYKNNLNDLWVFYEEKLQIMINFENLFKIQFGFNDNLLMDVLYFKFKAQNSYPALK